MTGETDKICHRNLSTSALFLFCDTMLKSQPSRLWQSCHSPHHPPSGRRSCPQWPGWSLSCFPAPGPDRHYLACVSPSQAASAKFSASPVWVLVYQGELWVLELGDPRKSQMSALLGGGWKRTRRRERWREGNLRVQNAKCWCVCFPSLLFRAMTEGENKRQHWYITYRRSTLFSKQ